MNLHSEPARRHDRWPDVLACLVLVAIVVLVFGRRSGLLGFYADDAGFLVSIHPGMSLAQVAHEAMNYVTGRNLHIVWQYLVTVVAGGRDLENLAAMHYLQVLGDCVNALLVFAMLRAWGFRRVGAFVGAMLFALFGFHGETHFWLSALPMNIGSTFFVLLLLLGLAYLVRAVRQGDRVAANWLALPIALAFACAMFTYDQVVPVVMASTCLVLLYAALDRRFRAAAALGLAVVFGIAAALVLWKASDPGGGPAFSQLSAAHVWAKFQESVGLWRPALSVRPRPIPVPALPEYAEILRDLGWIGVVFPAAALATPADRVVAFGLALLAAVLVYLLARREEGPEPQRAGAWPVVALPRWSLPLAAIAFFVLAYLPGYLWFLSPRHAYLPSVGFAALVAAGITLLPARWLRVRAVAFVIAAIGAVQVASYALADQAEREAWIESYAVRKQIFETVGASAQGTGVDVLLAGFPSAPQPYGPPMAFLSAEQASGIALFTRGRVTPRSLALHPVPAAAGYFVRTEEDQWGQDAFAYVPRAQTLVFVYQGRSEGSVRFARDTDGSLFRKDAFYTLAPAPAGATQGVERFAAKASGTGFEIATPPVDLGPGEVLAVVACEGSEGRLTPIFQAGPGDFRRFLVPVEVPAAAMGGVARLAYKVPQPGIVGFRLYRVGREKATPLAEAVVAAEARRDEAPGDSAQRK